MSLKTFRVLNMNPSPLLAIRNITKSFEGAPLLQNISLAIASSETSLHIR